MCIFFTVDNIFSSPRICTQLPGVFFLFLFYVYSVNLLYVVCAGNNCILQVVSPPLRCNLIGRRLLDWNLILKMCLDCHACQLSYLNAYHPLSDMMIDYLYCIPCIPFIDMYFTCRLTFKIVSTLCHLLAYICFIHMYIVCASCVHRGIVDDPRHVSTFLYISLNVISVSLSYMYH